MEKAKRRVPKVSPVSHDGIRYEAVRGAKARGFEQNGGVLAAVNEASDRELWTLVVYKVHYDRNEEADVQDVFITNLAISPDGKQLNVTNEAGKRFVVTLADRSVKQVE